MQDRSGSEAPMALVHGGELTQCVIELAMDVHRELGPGLLESAYEECLCCELQRKSIGFVRQVPLAINYKGVRLPCAYKMDLVIEKKVLIELKALEHLLPIHESQTLTYLKLSGLRVALLMNFGGALLRDGLRRFVM
jgi:GxxExxY protein